MVTQGANTRNNKKGEKGESDGAKGYVPDDLSALIQGITLSIANLDKKIDTLNQDKIDVDELNRARDQFEAGIKVVCNLATEANMKASDAAKEAADIKKNSAAPTTPVSSFSTHARIASTTCLDKCKLALAQSLNTKEISTQLSAIKLSSNSMQSMTLFYANVALMAYAGTYGVVLLPEFKNIDENFRHRDELVPPPTHPEYNA